VLILGDKKQFSNIKAGQARTDTNREYLNDLALCFRNNVSTDATKLVRLDKFNIKTSILEFFEFISNYNIQLRKHFRGYKEIISYSNKYFYQETLQVMKIRGKSIDEVIKFSYVKPTADDELYPNTNAKEVEFIISELKRLKEENKSVSVGIITPHTNQQKLLVEMIGKMPEWDYFQDKLQLKIMTFDTCQGEERDIIYYSMVASADSDKLWGVFIKDLSNVDIEEDGQIKAQRLNVGFSRAKECVHFVLSKPLEDFSGSVGEALRHYQYILEEAKKEHDVSEVDEKSKMEPEVLNWFYQTKFWQQHKNTIEFWPQFEIGKYLKQLDPKYTHPAYKVDFLIIYTDEQHKEHKIIIEYDGFREHFKDADEVNEFNYQNYYSDDDVYRQKVLESYGYKFLRINKFNSGENPIASIDERIGYLLKNSDNTNPLLVNIHGTIEGLQNGEMRECPKCKEVKSVKDFKDNTLITGYGRFCNQCKNVRAYDVQVTPKPPQVLSDKICPRCNARMVLRNGRRGKFYGCSRFPYCKGTRPA
jgi:ssDNA-binding Zn-finger/Zn-ribbon topoisomerase 1